MIFVDLDGVLVDLVGGLEKRIGKDLSDRNDFNKEYSKFAKETHPFALSQFWAKLPPTKDCEKLWNVFKSYKPLILSSVSGCINAVYGKELWCFTNLAIQSDRVFLSQNSKDKELYASAKSLLIDDYDKNVERFRNAGGMAIHHTDTDKTIDLFLRFIENNWIYPRH
jgi:FMN phosphatase YigB (HAD superfamily)